MPVPTREEALALLREYNANESLIKHALAVEATMRHMARLRGQDEDFWGAVGIVHDLDYERSPSSHPHEGARILRERGWPEEAVHAVLSHAWGMGSDVEPVHVMEKILYAIDELTGLVTAAVLVRPSRDLRDLTVSSLKKKWKDKGFAAGANRDVIARGAEMLGLELDALMSDVLDGMRAAADVLELDGRFAGGGSGA
ncbi:MAG: HDIG domain-containing metalloprotein [Candidatus Bipolaricaulota bacterium]